MTTAMRLAALTVLFGVAMTSATLRAGAASVITVTTTADAVNGDVSSPAALAANPGADGTSLREAITAANAAPGPHTITFAASLAGQTIAPATQLPPLSRDRTVVTGLTDAVGNPAVTLSGELLRGSSPIVLGVRASWITIRHLRFVRTPEKGRAIEVRAGAGLLAAPNRMESIRIDRNVFSNEGGAETAWAVNIGTDEPAVDSTLSSVWIARNTFVHFRGDGDEVLAQVDGKNCSIENLVVHDNTFIDATFSVELVTHNGTGGRIRDAQILRNTFTNYHAAISIGTGGGEIATSGGVIEGTIIAGNSFSDPEQSHPTIQIVGGYNGATDSVVRDTLIVNNVLARGGMISLVGGENGRRSRIEDIALTNNTIDNGGGPGLAVLATHIGGGVGGPGDNSVTGVMVSNTIFHGAGGFDGDFHGEVTAAMIEHSIVGGSRFAGMNGNIQADPGWVDAPRRDFHLRAGSPAVDAGTPRRAPPIDFDGRGRTDGHVDIGAYELGGTTRPLLAVAISQEAATGEIASIPAGIDCPTVCSSPFDPGSSVTLTANPWPGARFAGWLGACAGGGACIVTMDAAKSVTATFVPITHVLSATATGKGRVTSGPHGIACPPTCSADIREGDTVTLTAAPERGYRVEWSGACTGEGACTVTMDAAKSVTATFVQITHSLSVTVAGKGRVTTSPPGIACPGRCTASVAEGTTIKLTATPASGYRFARWSGACSGRAACTLAVSADTTVRANFARLSLCKKAQRSTKQRPCRRR